MYFRCPDCKSTLFHVEKVGDKYTIKCFKTKECHWQKDLVETDDNRNSN